MALNPQVGDRFLAKKITFKDTKAVQIVTVTKTEHVVEIHLKAAPDNAQPVFIGDAGDQLWELTEPRVIHLSRPDQLYVKGAATEGVIVLLVSSSGEIKQPGCN
jgi:hypothetical protein